MRTVRGGLFIEVKTNSEAVLQKALELHKEKIAYYLVWYKNKKNEKSEYISLFFFSKYKKEVVEFIK